MSDAARLNIIPRPRESAILGPAVAVPRGVELIAA